MTGIEPPPQLFESLKKLTPQLLCAGTEEYIVGEPHNKKCGPMMWR